MISELSQNAKWTKLQLNFIRYEVLSTIVRMVTKLIDHWKIERQMNILQDLC